MTETSSPARSPAPRDVSTHISSFPGHGVHPRLRRGSASLTPLTQTSVGRGRTLAAGGERATHTASDHRWTPGTAGGRVVTHPAHGRGTPRPGPSMRDVRRQSSPPKARRGRGRFRPHQPRGPGKGRSRPFARDTLSDS